MKKAPDTPDPIVGDPDATFWEAYWSGEISPSARARLDDWLGAEAGRRELLEVVRASLTNGEFPGYSTEQRRRRVWEILEAAEAAEPVKAIEAAPQAPQILSVAERVGETRLQAHSGANSRYRWMTGIGITIAAICLMVGWRTARYRINTELSGQRSVYTTGPGERATITLPDGSTVMLNVASRLEVRGDFMARTRTVQLDGEAVFTVTPNSGAPFTVRAGPSLTRVLGTRFVVRHYSTDTTATIAVEQGRVDVQSTIVSANQEIVIGAKTVSTVRTAQPGRFAFTEGVLTLSPTSLGDAIMELNRWYNADIRLGDAALATRPVEGRFVVGSLTDLIEVLEWTFNLRVVREGRQLTLYPKA